MSGLYLPAMNVKQWLDSLYRELNILTPDYFSVQWGAKYMADVLNRAYISLLPDISKVDQSAFRKRATLTVTASGTDLYVALPSDYVAFLGGSVGTYKVSMRGIDADVLMHNAIGFQPSGDIPVTREGDRLVFHSSAATAGASMKLIYACAPPIVSLEAKLDLTGSSNPYTFTLPASKAHFTLMGGALAYAADDWVGGMFFDVTTSKYGYITGSTLTTLTVREYTEATMTAATGHEVVLVHVPKHSPIVMSAVVAMACLILKGKDLGRWQDRVDAISKGGVPHDVVDAAVDGNSIYDRD